jgi:uncharacterized protein (TIGR00369 family)
MGVAYVEAIGSDIPVATVELKVNFLRPVCRGTLTAEARLFSTGRILALLGCDVTDDRGRLISHATSTFATLTGDQAEGRRSESIDAN